MVAGSSLDLILADTCVWCKDDNLELLERAATSSPWLRTAKGCGHQICRSCRGTAFGYHTKAKCRAPGCGQMVKKGELSDKSREELAFERECKIRREHSREFNRTADDFAGEGAVLEEEGMLRLDVCGSVDRLVVDPKW